MLQVGPLHNMSECTVPMANEPEACALCRSMHILSNRRPQRSSPKYQELFNINACFLERRIDTHYRNGVLNEKCLVLYSRELYGDDEHKII
jgi:hypothetical protein